MPPQENEQVKIAVLEEKINGVEKDIKAILTSCRSHHDTSHAQVERLAVMEENLNRANADIQILFTRNRNGKKKQYIVPSAFCGAIIATWKIIEYIITK
jgi:hypothetical protein